ncbi:MAG: hypothetical protein QM831_08310 [Kofleriaceae bacterium]
MRRFWLLVVFASCVDSNSVTCGDRLCPAGTVCDSHSLCVLPEQVSACANGSADMACTYGDGSAGFCTGGTCLVPSCGDHIVEHGEMCDSPTDGSKCSSDCKSDLTCGNHIVDLATGESCDDQNHVDGDGCSSNCQVEVPTWTERVIHPGTRYAGAAAYDSHRDRVEVFGGLGTGTTLADLIEWDGETWIRPYQATAPSPRDTPAMAYDADLGVTLLFGGELQNLVVYGDSWTWDGNTWRVVDGVGPQPSSAAAMAYDPRDKVVVLFGGLTGVATASPSSGETWEWNGAWIKQSRAVAPTKRYGASMAYDPKHGAIVMAGGVASRTNPQQTVAETWTYANHTWTQVANANTPVNLAGGVLAWDPQLEKLVWFGGRVGSVVTSAIYAWDGSTWTQLGATIPNTTQADQQGARFRDHVVLFGGRNGGGVATDVTELWSAQTFTAVPEIGMRYGAMAANLPLARSAVFFGGYTQQGTNQAQNDTWRFTTDGDSLLSMSGPDSRGFACMAWDPLRKNVMMALGAETNTYRLDTWTFDGSTWTNQLPAQLPTKRDHIACAFDGSTITIVGGANPGAIMDAWSWTGTTWQPTALDPGIAARNDVAAAYDADVGMVMFGGSVNLAPTYADTWTFAASTWNSVTGFAPSARNRPVMVWNPARDRAVLVGGNRAAVDVYEFDGQWHAVNAINAPPERHGMTAWTSLDGGGVEFFGGQESDPFASTPATATDGYELRYVSAIPHEKCDGTDNDRDGLVRCDDPDCWTICYPACPLATTCDPSKGPYCGDGVCDAPRETGHTCPADCPVTVQCGDGYCDTGESTQTCPGDCP